MNFEELLNRLKSSIKETGGSTSEIKLPPNAFVLTDKEGRTLLMRAAADGELELVQFLLSRNPETSSKSESPEKTRSSAPMKLIEELESSIGAVSSLSGNLDTTDYHGMTALLHAAAMGHEKIVFELLDAGADPDIYDFSGRWYRELLEASDVQTDTGTLRQELSLAYTKKFAQEHYYDLTEFRDELDELNEVNADICLEECKTAQSGGRSTHNSATQQCIEQIESTNFSYRAVDWDNVDITALTRYILERKKPTEVSLSGKALPFFVELIVRIARENENWGPAILSRFNFELSHSTIGDSSRDPRDPRVLWNGCVFIHNFHRVMGLFYQATMFLSDDEREEFYTDIRKLGDEVWMISSKDGMIQQIDDPADANLHGNNIIGILDVDAIEGTSLLSKNLVEETLAGDYDALGGVDFRLFAEGVHIYSVGRMNDEFDFAHNYLFLFNENTDPVPISEVFCAKGGKFWWIYKGSDERKKTEQKEREYLYETISAVFQDTWEYYMEDIASLSEAETRTIPLYGNRSLYNLLLGEALYGTRSSLDLLFSWFVPRIFADSQDLVHGYGGSYEIDNKKEFSGKPFILSVSINNPASVDYYDRLIEELFENEEFDKIFGEYGNHPPLRQAIDRGEIIAEINMIKDSVTSGEWRPLTVENLEKFKRRLVEIAENEFEGNWDDFEDALMGPFTYDLLRLRFGLKHGEPLALREMGIRLSEKLAEAEGEGEERMLGDGIYMQLPSMGLQQFFCSGDLDSGNM